MPASILSSKRYKPSAIAAAAKVSKEIEARYSKWLVSLQFLVDQSDVDYVFSRQPEFCESIILEEGERITEHQRLLLEVEKERVHEKRQEDMIRQQRHESVSELIQKEAEDILSQRFKENTVERLVGIHAGFEEFLSFAYSPQLTFSRLGAIVINYRNLANSVMELVKNPRFCKQVGKTPKSLTEGKAAIGFIGIENCRTIFPVLLAKPLLKWADHNTKVMTPKVWQHTILMANVTRMRLADAGYKEPDEGVFIGIIRSMALFAACNHFSDSFEVAKENIIKEFRENKMRDEYFACAEIRPTLGFLPKVILKLEKKLTKRIIDYIDWDMRTVHLKNALLEDISGIPILERSLHGAALGQARAYAIYDLMSRTGAFEKEKAPYWMANMAINSDIFSSIRRREPGKFKFTSEDLLT